MLNTMRISKTRSEHIENRSYFHLNAHCVLLSNVKYSGVRVIASRILHEICLLIGELAIRGTKLTLNARSGTKSYLLINEYCL